MSAALNAVARDLQKSLAIERMINFDPSPFLATAGYCLFFLELFLLGGLPTLVSLWRHACTIRLRIPGQQNTYSCIMVI